MEKEIILCYVYSKILLYESFKINFEVKTDILGKIYDVWILQNVIVIMQKHSIVKSTTTMREVTFFFHIH